MLTPDWSSTRQAILGEMGESLLLFMRDVYFGRISPSVDQEVVSLALRLDLIAKDRTKNWQLTPHGALVADSAREYCNWIDDKRLLPPSIAEAELAGMTVLDLGCGFGRHVFSASRVASLAVGLEAEPAYLKMSSILGCREGVDYPSVVCGVGEKIPFADSVFDVIICTRSLPYMDASVAIPEMARVLRVGGKIFLLVATFGQFAREFFGGPQHTPGIRERLRVAKQAINSIGVNWFGKRIFQRKNSHTTASYVLLTTGRLKQIMEDAGLKVVTQSTLRQTFIIERIR